MPKIQPLSLCIPSAQSLFTSSNNSLYGPDLFTDLLFANEHKEHLIRKQFEGLIRDGKIKILEDPKILWYVVQKGNQWFSGFVTGIPIDEIKRGKISLHEHVMQKRVNDFTNYLSTTGLQAEPVLLFHEDNKGINALEDELCKRSPDFYYKLGNERHELWLLSAEQENCLNEHCKTLAHFHLADGHHRLQSTLQWAEKNSRIQSLLSYVISKKEVSNGSFIWGLKKWPNDLNSKAFHRKLEEMGAQSARYDDRLGKEHQVLIEFENKVHSLNPKTEKDPADFIFTEVLGFTDNAIHNIKNYFDYFPNRTELDFNALPSKDYCAKIATVPLSIDRLIERALSNEKLPPKSTFIRPKIPTGFLVVRH